MNKKNYLKLSKMIADGEDIEKINLEFDAARDAMDSIDGGLDRDLIPKCFGIAWDTAYEDLHLSYRCSPEKQLKALKECLDVIEYFEWKHYM